MVAHHMEEEVQCCEPYPGVTKRHHGQLNNVTDVKQQLMPEQNDVLHSATQHDAAQDDARHQVCPGFVDPE